MTTPLPRIAARLRELREEAGLTQAELARSAGLVRGTLRNWEQGRGEPDFSGLESLAKALGIDAASFFDEPGSRTRRLPGRPKKSEG